MAFKVIEHNDQNYIHLKVLDVLVRGSYAKSGAPADNHAYWMGCTVYQCPREHYSQ